MQEVSKEIADLANNAPVSDDVKTIHVTEEDLQGNAPEQTAEDVLDIVPREDGYSHSVSLIVAMNKRGVIGDKGALPWKLRKDMQFFKRTTTDSVVIMGRKTWDSLGGKPLPNRINIVVTRDLAFVSFEENTMVAHSIESALHLAKCENRDIFFIGGATIYEQCLPFCDTLYITSVDNEAEGDCVYPAPEGPSELGNHFKTFGFNHASTIEKIEPDEKNECGAEIMAIRKVNYPEGINDKPKIDVSMIKKFMANAKRNKAALERKTAAKEKRVSDRRKKAKAKKKAQRVNRR